MVCATMRLVNVCLTLLPLMASCCSGSVVCEKVILSDQKGTDDSLCYDDGSKQIKCPRNQTLRIVALLQRVHKHGECGKAPRDSIYDIGRCLLNTPDVQEKTVYEAAVREVLEECSQRRYCILESDKTSSIHGLADLPVGEANRLPSHLVVMHQCVKEQVASVVLCDSETQTDTEVYISSNPLRMSARGTSTCTCRVSGPASHVTLLDVRLGSSNRTRLSITDTTRSVYTFHGGQQAVHFMEEIRMSQSEWSLHVDVLPDHFPDKIWLRVAGNNSSKVTVTCEESKAAIPTNMPPSSPGEHHTLIIFVCVGFVTGLVCAGSVLGTLVKRRSGHSGPRSREGRGNREDSCSQPAESRVQQPVASPEGDEPHYHVPDEPRDHVPARSDDYYLVPIHHQAP